MNIHQFNKIIPDKKLAAVCGLFCVACSAYIGTHDDRKRLERLSVQFNREIEDLECNGCRSDKRSFYCREKCIMAKCAADKGIEFCYECVNYPCKELEEFQAQMPHRLELWKSFERIKEVGYEKWFKEMIERFSCAECGAINSAYDLECRKCRVTPSCDFVNEHKEEIMKYFKKLK